MEIFGKIYKIDPKEFVNRLAKKFNFRGVDYHHVKDMVFLCCPFHNNGQERTASANFSLVDKGNTREGDFYCFGCHQGGHISSILARLFGDKKLASDWVEEIYGNFKGLVEEKRVSRRIEPKKGEEEKQIFDLDTNAYLYETTYYEKRGIPDDLVKRFRLGYLDSENESLRRVYLPVFDKEGNVVFYQTRNIHSKSFYLPKGAKKIIWGANEITSTEVVVCESVFNALTCWKFGKQAIALFGTGDEKEYEQLLELPSRHFILGLDNDEAGRKGMKALSKFLRDNGKLVSRLVIDESGKDLNDFAKLSNEEFIEKWNKWFKRGNLL